MITGEKYELDQKFEDFYNNAVDHSRLLNTVVNEGYELTAYDDGGDAARKPSGTVSESGKERI